MSAAEGSELRRALIGLLLGIALGALIGLLARREPPTRELA
jgi:ABC-type nitrate/sulfonate/bicarbonate transport system permease component